MATIRLLFLLLACLLVPAALSAQVAFEQIPGIPPASQLVADVFDQAYGDAAVGDINGDSHPDLIISGIDWTFAPATFVYLNNGHGSFSIAQSSLEALANSSVELVDVDGDSDLDVLIAGHNFNFFAVTDLYRNDGTGTFTKDTTVTFTAVAEGDITTADFDLDGDPDFLASGVDDLGTLSSTLYLNDGTGAFAEVMGTPFAGMHAGSIAATDLNSDTLPDIIITGEDATGTPLARLYINADSNVFNEDTTTLLTPVSYSAIALGDLDGDTDSDAIITGLDMAGQETAHAFKNDGSGVFTLFADTVLNPVSSSAAVLLDVDGDTDLDVLLSGSDVGSSRSTTLYFNDGTGTFTQAAGNAFEGVNNGALRAGDFDGDNDADVVLIGEGVLNFGTAFSGLYENDGSGTFVLATGTPFEAVQKSAMATADLDGDLDPDIIVAGENVHGTFVTALYLTNGNAGYSAVVPSPFDSVRFGAIGIADIDGDGDNDVLITGEDNASNRIAKLYTNDSTGTFTEVMGTPFEGVYDGALAFADVDMDNDQDVLITGLNNNMATRVAKLYSNDGSGTFTEVMGTPFLPVYNSTVTFGDLTGDTVPDLILTGSNSFFPQQPAVRQYTNNGTGSFTQVTTALPAILSAAVGLADLDGDGDQDVLLSGVVTGSGRSTKQFTNDGTGAFTEVMSTPFPGLTAGALALADVEGDGDQDVLLSGYDTNDLAHTGLYVNDGTGAFSSMTGMPFADVWNGAVAFTDLDGDSDPDVVLSGLDNTSVLRSLLFRNNTCAYPEGRGAKLVQNTSVKLAWDTVYGAIGYRIFYKVQGSSGWNTAFKQTNQGVLTINGLTPGTTYAWFAQTVCGQGWLGPRSPNGFFTTLSGACNPPVAAAVSPLQAHQARLNWTKDSDALKYRIRWRAQGASSWTKLAKDSTWSRHWLTGLSAATTYEWQIKSVCAKGKNGGSLWSAMQVFATPASAKMNGQFSNAQSEVGAELVVFPNPAGRFAWLHLSASIAPKTVRIYNAVGQLMHQVAVAGETLQTRIELEAFPAGIYVVQVSGGANGLQRLIVE